MQETARADDYKVTQSMKASSAGAQLHATGSVRCLSVCAPCTAMPVVSRIGCTEDIKPFVATAGS